MGRRHAAPSGLRAAHRAGKLLLHGQLCCLPQEEPRGNRAVVTEQVPSLQRHSHLILFVPMLLETVQEMLPCSVNRFLLMVIVIYFLGGLGGSHPNSQHILLLVFCFVFLQFGPHT